MKEGDIIKLAFCNWPGNRMLLLGLSKELIVIKLSLRKIAMEWVGWTGQGMEGREDIRGVRGRA